MSFPSCLRPLRGSFPRPRAWRGLGLVLAVVVLGRGQPAAAQYIFIDLNPSGPIDSVAYGVSDGQQGGYAYTDNQNHALLWTGSADNVVDLHPSGFDASFVRGVSDGQQVGDGDTPDGSYHALLWTGSADSVVDLHPAGFLTRSPLASPAVSRWAMAKQAARFTPGCGRGAPTVWST